LTEGERHPDFRQSDPEIFKRVQIEPEQFERSR
jgi:hypothetical protein